MLPHYEIMQLSLIHDNISDLPEVPEAEDVRCIDMLAQSVALSDEASRLRLAGRVLDAEVVRVEARKLLSDRDRLMMALREGTKKIVLRRRRVGQ